MYIINITAVCRYPTFFFHLKIEVLTKWNLPIIDTESKYMLI